MGGEDMETAEHVTVKKSSMRPRYHTIDTTLYDVVEAVAEQVHPTEEWVVASVVAHLLENRRITLAGNSDVIDAVRGVGASV
jgi:hypothetical protein